MIKITDTRNALFGDETVCDLRLPRFKNTFRDINPHVQFIWLAHLQFIFADEVVVICYVSVIIYLLDSPVNVQVVEDL